MTEITPKTGHFGTATRDYIPEEEPKTAWEIERTKQLRAMGAGRVRLDFIPVEGFVIKPPSGKMAQGDEAISRALANQWGAEERDYADAVEKLRKLNVAQTIEAINQAPSTVQELLIVAETLNGHRSSVLNKFPQIDPLVVARWEKYTSTNEASVTDGELPTVTDAEE